MNKKFPAQFHFTRLPVRCWNPAIIGDRSCILQLFPGFHAKKTVFPQTNSSPVSLFGKFSHLLWPLCGISATQSPGWRLDTEKPQAMNRSDNKTEPRLSPAQSPPVTPPMSLGNCFAICLSILGRARTMSSGPLTHGFYPITKTRSPAVSRILNAQQSTVHPDYPDLVSTTISCDGRGCSRKCCRQHLGQFHGSGVGTIFPAAGQQTSVLFT